MQIAHPSTDSRLLRSGTLQSSGLAFRLPRKRALVAPVVAILACGVLSGCKLIDQKTFDSSAGRRPIAHVPPPRPAPPPPLPLASVRYQADPASWQPGLADIVRMALARKPQALFQVETLVPATGTPQAQAAALAAAGRAGGESVAETIVSAGASSSQIEMSARTDPSVKQPEVQVFVK